MTARIALRRVAGRVPRRRSLLAATVAGVLLLLSGCTIGPSERPALATFGTAPAAPSTASSSQPLGPGGSGQLADPIRWEPCGDVDSVDKPSGLSFTVECGSVVVDRSSPNSFGDPALEVARARAPGVPTDAPAVLVLRGEPGENGRSQVASVAAGLSPAVRNHFAVITVDLVGTGRSGLVDCLSGFDTRSLMTLGVDPTEPASATALAELARSLTFECGDVAGPELSRVNTTSATDDLDALRAALGQQALTLIGQGFGGTLAAVYADRYPARVSSAVIDAPTDPLDALDVRATAIAVAAEKALGAFAASCADFQGGCPLGADPRAQIDKAVSTLNAPPGAGPGSGITNGGSVLLALLLRLGDPAGWPTLATALAAAAKGDGGPVQDLLDESLGLDSDSGWLNAAIIYGCNDSSLRISPQQMSAAVDTIRPQAPLLGPYTLGLVGLCSSWPAPEAALGAVKATGAAPILVLGAVDDPTAPYEAVRSLAGQLDSARLLSWQSGQHGSYPDSACVTTAVDAYLLAGDLPAVGSLCPP
jgi:pimeloyl-ACP methyl ester carboxylesterase